MILVHPTERVGCDRSVQEETQKISARTSMVEDALITGALTILNVCKSFFSSLNLKRVLPQLSLNIGIRRL